jgi:hypothetical protein
MWGHRIMATRGPIVDAKQHFIAALAAGRERDYVRNMEFAAMLYYREPSGQIEAARIAEEMRKAGETIVPDLRERLWRDVYTDSLVSRDRRAAFLTALRDGDGAATFRWLYPESEVRADRNRQWRFMMAMLEETAGQRAAARSRFETLRDDLVREGASGPLLDDTIAAARRLQGP